MKLKLFLLLVGVIGGAALMHFFGAQARQAAGLEGRQVEANVLEEHRDEDGRLVLMLESEGESMLATFRERADDVASLVSVGDVVTFRAPSYGVFSDDVPLLSVRRGTGSREGTDASEGDESLEGDTEDSDESNGDADEPAEGEEIDAEALSEEGGEEADPAAEEAEETEDVDSEPPVPLAGATGTTAPSAPETAES